MVKTHSRPVKPVSRFAVLFVAAVAAIGATGAAASFVPTTPDQQTVIAEFQNIGPLTNGSQVKVAGVAAGLTGAAEVDPVKRVARVPLNVDKTALPLHTDAHATVDQLSLIGEKYVDLNPGSPTAPILPPGGTIPVTQTQYANDYQNIVQALDDPTAAGLASFTGTLGNGIDGKGHKVATILRELAPAFQGTDQLVQALGRQNDMLGRVVEQTAPVTAALAADNGKTLDKTVDSATQLLGATASRDQQLQATLAELPSTLTAAQKTLNDVTAVAQNGQATLGQLRPTADQLPQISQELGSFTDAANPALSAAQPLLDRANALLDQARPAAALLRQAGPNLYNTVHGARPITNDLSGNVGNVLQFLRNWSLVTNKGDAISHYFRVFFVVSDESVTGTLPANPLAQNPLAQNPLAQRATALPGGVQLPTTTAVPQLTQLVPQAQNLLPGGTLLQGVPQANGSATGLTLTQEQNALGTLLGGR